MKPCASSHCLPLRQLPVHEAFGRMALYLLKLRLTGRRMLSGGSDLDAFVSLNRVQSEMLTFE